MIPRIVSVAVGASPRSNSEHRLYVVREDGELLYQDIYCDFKTGELMPLSSEWDFASFSDLDYQGV